MCTTAGYSYLSCESEADSDDETGSDTSLEIPQLDARRYLYSNIVDGAIVIQDVRITSVNQSIDMEVNASNAVLHNLQHAANNMQLTGNLCGDLTIARAGIRAKVEYKDRPPLKMKVIVQIKGNVGYCQDTLTVYENILFFPKKWCSIH